MSSGGGGGGQSSVESKLPQWVDTASQDVYAKMATAMGRGYQDYGGQTVAGTNQDTQDAYARVRAMQGQADPTYASALNIATGLAGNAKAATPADIEALRQQFVNPFQQDVINRSVGTLEDQAARAGAQRAAQAGNVGAFGGSRYGVENAVAAGETAKASGDLASQLNLQGYNTSLQTALGLNSQNQQLGMAGLQMMPQIAGARANQTATEAALMEQIGTAQQQQTQNELNDKWRRWLEERDYPVEAAQMLGQTIGGLPYGSTQISQAAKPGKANPLVGAASGAAAGASIGSVVPGYGTAIGAGVGGLLGYFGSR